jgi:type II secretory pathway pseudopilin PulG
MRPAYERLTAHRRQHRRGITLLEVMISIGIVAISIFGLLALLPVAGQQAERGLVNDRAAAAGRNAVAEFHAREMARLEVQGGNVYASHWCNGGSSALFPLFQNLSYCIDPMYVTRRVAQGNFNPPYNGFPDVSGVNQMQRVNLRAGEWPPRQVVVPDFNFDPSASKPVGYFVPNNFHYVPASVPNNIAAVNAMRQLQADYIFTAHDDLVFNRNEGQPGSAAVPLPIQQMASQGVRQTDGAFNWMATLVPKSPQDRSEYILSIVVFHDRPINQVPHMSHDRVVQINDGSGSAPNTNFYSQGVGGGDVRITPRTGRPITDVEVRRGQWVLLTPSTKVSYFRWYRVIEADYQTDAGGGRPITLQGEDWPMAPGWVVPALRQGFSFPYVIIPPNVVAVFSRSVRFEETTAWYE